jgi:hypothetical protein
MFERLEMKRDTPVGQVFGRWTVQGIAERSSSGSLMWRCLCECGTVASVYSHDVPNNCCWATYAEQAKNKRTSVTGMYQGKLWCMAELARAHGVDRAIASARMRKRGWAFIDACTTPAKSRSLK